MVEAAPSTEASGVLQIVRDRGQQRRAQAVGLHGALDPVHVLDQQHALDRERALVHQRIEQAALVRRQQRPGPVVVDADDADRPAPGSHRQEQPLGARQRIGAAPGRAIVAPRPVRGGQIGLVELVLRRVARLDGQHAILRQQQHHAYLQHQRGLIGGRPQHIVQRRGARELAAEGVERFRGPHPADRGIRLGTHPRRDIGNQKRDQHEEEERRDIGRIRAPSCAQRVHRNRVVSSNRSISRSPLSDTPQCLNPRYQASQSIYCGKRKGACDKQFGDVAHHGAARDVQ